MPAYNVFKSGPRKGTPKTLKDRVIRYLTDGLGFEEVDCRSGRYRQFSSADRDRPLFVGLRGAVRKGNCATKSVSVTDSVRSNMERWEETLVN